MCLEEARGLSPESNHCIKTHGQEEKRPNRIISEFVFVRRRRSTSLINTPDPSSKTIRRPNQGAVTGLKIQGRGYSRCRTRGECPREQYFHSYLISQSEEVRWQALVKRRIFQLCRSRIYTHLN